MQSRKKLVMLVDRKRSQSGAGSGEGGKLDIGQRTQQGLRPSRGFYKRQEESCGRAVRGARLAAVGPGEEGMIEGSREPGRRWS